MPGELVGLLGPSGAGKSTLLMALSGFRPAQRGRVRLGDQDLYGKFEELKRLLGFVPQSEIIHRDLTVEKVLYYAARLRLPAETTEKAVEGKVRSVLKLLELAHRGSVKVRSLSGGQRKRVSIGVELITSPPVLFADEPTSGLDPALEQKVMELFARLAKGGRTVVITTHVMASLETLDLMALLHEGWLVFYGPPKQALPYFGVDNHAELFRKLATVKGRALAERYSDSKEFRSHLAPRLVAGGTGSALLSH